MNISNFCQISDKDISITDIVCLFQDWDSRNKSFSYKKKPRPNNGIILVTGGPVIYSMQNGSSVSAAAGDIIYIPKGAYYFVEFMQIPQRTMLINFFAYDHEGKEVTFFDNITKIMSGANGFIFDLFAEICNIYLKASNKFIIKAKVLELIDIIATHCIKPEPVSSIMPAIDYIDNHLNEVLKISHLAKLCAMSESTFRREFICINGVPPKQYIQEKKIKKSKQLLSNSELSINEICSALGFYDVAHFSKQFKSSTGITPLQYREKH